MRHFEKLLAVVLGFCWVFSAGAQQLVIDDAQLDRLGVRFVSPESTGESISSVFPGQMRLPVGQQHVIGVPLAGRVIRIGVSIGDQVEKSDVLAELESPELLDRQRSYLSAASEYKLREADYERDQALFKEGIIAQRRLLEARNAFEQARASLREQQQTLQIIGMDEKAIQLLAESGELGNRINIVSPVSGYVLSQEISLGDHVDTGSTLMRIGQPNPLWLVMDVPAELAGALQLGSRVDTAACEGASGQVMSIGQSVDPVSQTVQVRAEFMLNPTTAACLRPGQFVQARIAIAQADLYSVPRSAVVYHQSRALVFVRTTDGVDAMDVEVISRDERSLQLRAQFTNDVKVAVSGMAALKAAWLGMGGGD